MIPFTTKCWLCSGNLPKGSILSVNTSLANYFYTNSKPIDIAKFVYKWFRDEECQEGDKDPTTRLLSFLDRYYVDNTNVILSSPIMMGMMCEQMKRIPIDLLYEMQESSPLHWNLHHSLIMEHLLTSQPVDIIGFYSWLAKYVGHNATSPDLVEKYWSSYSMGIDLDIFSLLQEKGLFIPTLTGSKVVYRWSDRYMVDRIDNISFQLLTQYRMRNLTKGIQSISIHSYRLLPGKHMRRIRTSG